MKTHTGLTIASTIIFLNFLYLSWTLQTLDAIKELPILIALGLVLRISYDLSKNSKSFHLRWVATMNFIVCLFSSIGYISISGII